MIIYHGDMLDTFAYLGNDNNVILISSVLTRVASVFVSPASPSGTFVCLLGPYDSAYVSCCRIRVELLALFERVGGAARVSPAAAPQA